MTLVQKREKDERCVLTREKSERKEGAIEQFLDRYWPRRYFKNLGFSWPVHSSLASSAKLDIVKVDTYVRHEFGINWEPSDYSIQMSPSC